MNYLLLQQPSTTRYNKWMETTCLYCQRPIDKPGRVDRMFCSPAHKVMHHRREATKERFAARMRLLDGSFVRENSHMYMGAMKEIDRQLRTMRSVLKSKSLYWGYRLRALGRSELLPPAVYPVISLDVTCRLNHLGKKVKTDYFPFYPAELPLVPITGWYSLIFVGEEGETEPGVVRDQYRCKIGSPVELPGCQALPRPPSRMTYAKS